MASREPRYSKEEFAERGSEIYERVVYPQMNETHRGKIVAIDIETEEFTIAEDTVTAANRLLKHRPEAQIWFVRVGHKGVHRFGPRSVAEKA